MQYFKTIAHTYKRIKKGEQINRKFVLYNKIFTMQYMGFDNNDVMYEGVRTELMLYIFYRPTTRISLFNKYKSLMECIG